MTGYCMGMSGPERCFIKRNPNLTLTLTLTLAFIFALTLITLARFARVTVDAFRCAIWLEWTTPYRSLTTSFHSRSRRARLTPFMHRTLGAARLGLSFKIENLRCRVYLAASPPLPSINLTLLLPTELDPPLSAFL